MALEAPAIPSYSVIRKLGEGGWAEVWLAEDQQFERKVAIKVLKPTAYISTSDREELFRREGKALAGFDHSNIVGVYAGGRTGDTLYMIMEYLPGGTLEDRMRRAPISIAESLGLITQIASALQAIHYHKIVHRDLKPNNVLMRNDTTPVLVDFGIARLPDEESILARNGLMAGTIAYMSPEHINREIIEHRDLDGRSDLFALGTLFHQLLTGHLPFTGSSPVEISLKILSEPAPRLSADVGMLQPLLDQLMAKDRERRYATALDFIEALRGTFIESCELRRQIGYSGTSLAWTSQLRLLGFELTPADKYKVREAQGKYLDKAKPVTPVVESIVSPLRAAVTPPRVPDYIVNEPIRLGKWTETWAAEHKASGRHVLIKFRRQGLLIDDSFDPITFEAGILSKLSHPSIATAIGQLSTAAGPFLVLENLPGGTLSRHVEGRDIHICEAVGLVVQLASALEMLHRNQLVLREFNLSSIMLRDDTTPVLMELSSALNPGSSGNSPSTADIEALLFLSPEQIRSEQISPASNMYSLGLVFYRLLTGRLPYDGGNVGEIARKHLNAALPKLPPPFTLLQHIFDRMLSKQVSQRYASVRDFSDDLQRSFRSSQALRKQIQGSGSTAEWSAKLTGLGYMVGN